MCQYLCERLFKDRSMTVLHWQKHRQEGDLFSSGWFHFRSTLLGHLGYIIGGYQTYQPSLQRPSKDLYILDTIKATWGQVEVGGDVPEMKNGFSVSLVDDGLACLFPLKESLVLTGESAAIYLLDVALLEWKRVELKLKFECHGSELTEFHTADFWEDRNIILANSSGNPSIGHPTANRTFILSLSTNELKILDSKGPPPTCTGHQSSCLMALQKKWFVFGGVAEFRARPGLNVLDFGSNSKPTWTELQRPRVTGVVRCGTLIELGGSLFVLGGTRPSAVNDDKPHEVMVYNIKANKWQEEEEVIQEGKKPPYGESDFHQCLIASNTLLYMIPSDRRPYNSYYKLELLKSET